MAMSGTKESTAGGRAEIEKRETAVESGGCSAENNKSNFSFVTTFYFSNNI